MNIKPVTALGAPSTDDEDEGGTEDEGGREGGRSKIMGGWMRVRSLLKSPSINTTSPDLNPMTILVPL